MSLLLLLLLWLFLDPWVECKVLKKGWQMLQRDYARHVEATEVQVHILAGHFVCFHSNDSFCCCRLLGFWWWTSQSFQCILSPPQKSISGSFRWKFVGFECFLIHCCVFCILCAWNFLGGFSLCFFPPPLSYIFLSSFFPANGC